MDDNQQLQADDHTTPVGAEDTPETVEESLAEAEVEEEEGKGELAEIEESENNDSPTDGGDTLEGSPLVPRDVDEEEEEPTPVADTATSLSKEWPGQWYVLHTYSGYEDAVSDSLKQRISSLDMQDKIFDVLVPKENQIEIKNGKRKIVEKKMFPGYVLVNMKVTEDSWYVVRNTPNVTGFIGSGTVPVPVSDYELKGIFKRMDVEEPKYKIDVSIGDLVHIKDGPFKNYDGSVNEIDEEKGKIKVLVSIFGRETPVELDFLQIKKA